MDKPNTGELNYLAAISFLENMLGQGLINPDDYCALEAKYADKYKPSFRHERPCKISALSIRQSERKEW